MVVWDLSAFRSISCLALADLENAHRAVCSLGCETAMVVSRDLQSPVNFNYLLARCRRESSAREAILFLYINQWQAA